MAKPMITIFNAETGEAVVREMNAAEFAQFEADAVEIQEKDAAIAKQKADKTALLAKLGITADEAALLLS